MAHEISLIAGDGIGPEITDATLQVLAATGIKFTWDRQVAGLTAVELSGDPLPEATLASIRGHCRPNNEE